MIEESKRCDKGAAVYLHKDSVDKTDPEWAKTGSCCCNCSRRLKWNDGKGNEVGFVCAAFIDCGVVVNIQGNHGYCESWTDSPLLDMEELINTGASIMAKNIRQAILDPGKFTFANDDANWILGEVNRLKMDLSKPPEEREYCAGCSLLSEKKRERSKVNYFTKHIPSFVEVYRPPNKVDGVKLPFETTEELLALEDVRKFQELQGFEGFYLSENMVMAVFAKDERWFVVGYVDDPSSVELPQWSAPKDKKTKAGG